MKRINQRRIEWDEVKSPKGRFPLFRRHISLALGSKKDTGAWSGGHPFDLELTRVPPGTANWPYHTHSAQWELYVVLSGQGKVRTPEGEFEISPGDCFTQPPGEGHQIRNPGREDLIFLCHCRQSAAGRYRISRFQEMVCQTPTPGLQNKRSELLRG
jgi:mannose-6-phosphate isomerase-like protein (cupin superfamily)